MVCVCIIGTSWHRWEQNIKIDLKEIVWGCGYNLSGSGQNPAAGSYKHSNKHLSFIKGGKRFECVSDY